MTEKERILNNNNGEIPDGAYDIVRIKGITNPADELATFKHTITAFLDNKNLHEEDAKWNTLLPRKIVRFTEQLEEDDYHKDDLISHIPSMIDGLKDIRDWEWYSSKLTNDGFEVIMKGIFRYIFRPLLHHQGIPHKSIYVEREGVEYPTKSVIDVLTYKTFNAVTFELKKK
jgi:hypothetical protein